MGNTRKTTPMETALKYVRDAEWAYDDQCGDYKSEDYHVMAASVITLSAHLDYMAQFLDKLCVELNENNLVLRSIYEELERGHR